MIVLTFTLQYTTSDDATNPKTHPMFSVDLKDYPFYKLWNSVCMEIAAYFSFKQKIQTFKNTKL